MPELLDSLLQVKLERIDDVLIVTGTGKSDDTPTHGLSSMHNGELIMETEEAKTARPRRQFLVSAFAHLRTIIARIIGESIRRLLLNLEAIVLDDGVRQ